MSDLSTAPRARLFTTWGTVLYADVGSGELRHGAIESSPANALFVADPGSAPARRQGWIMHDTGEGCEPTVCLAEHSWAVSSAAAREASATPTSLQIVPLERGLLGLRSGNLYLCAQPDGRLTLANTWCSTWECFLASEDWCTDARAMSYEPIREIAGAGINRRMIGKYIIDPRLRIKVSANTKKTKLLIYGYPYWSHGRVYYDICKHLYARGYVVDILNWQVDHASYIGEIIPFYDLVMTALDGVRTLVDIYGVPNEKVVALSHHETDLRILIDQKGVEVFDKFAGFGVVSYQLYDASAIFGVQRHPLVVQLGVDFSEFCADIPERLITVGYAGGFSHKTPAGIEIKRGELAEAAAREAGLAFKVAGSTGNQISFHDMPDFYRTVDAVLVSSVTEGAQLPVREAAAAGRLVISTPVGDFPLRAYQGGGIITPIESEKYTKFAAATLKYYKENPSSYVDMCRKIQDAAARQFDWQYMIGDWIELIETAKRHLLEQARSHQQAGRFAEAAGLFAKRADGGGDDEERWYARWQQARCLQELGDEEGFVRAALAAFRERPHRAEPLKDLVDYYIATQRAAPAAFYAEAALAIPKPKEDVLFVDDSLYETGLRHTFAVAASWSADAAQKERGRRVCHWLALSRDVPANLRAVARYNSGWYAEPAESLLPSLQFHPLPIAAPDGFHAHNLGICLYGDQLILIVRTVNWIFRDGRYLLLTGHPTYRSHLLFIEVDRDLHIVSSADVLPPEDLPPPRSQEDLGFRDPRPFIWRGEIWSICSIREFNDRALGEMILSRIDRRRQDCYVLTDWHVVPSGVPVQWEGNWMPQVAGDELRLIYSVDPTRVLTDTGAVLHNESPAIAADSFRGGSQAVPFDDGWLMVIHEVEHVNGRKRYFHRFIWMDSANRLRRLSRRFYLRQLGVEFVAGMAWHPDGKRLVISFTVEERDPSLAVVSASDVRAVLLDIDEHERASEQVVEAGQATWEALRTGEAHEGATHGGAAASLGPPANEPLSLQDLFSTRQTMEAGIGQGSKSASPKMRSTQQIGPAGARVFTTHGTFLHIDVSSGELRHGRVEASCQNVSLISDPRCWRLLHTANGCFLPIVCTPERCAIVKSTGEASVQPTDFELVESEKEWFGLRWCGLRSAGLFLCAEPDGRITLSRTICSMWESFLLSQPRSSAGIFDALGLLKPYDILRLNKTRIGNRRDGGYVLLDDFASVGAVYSIGIGDDVSFDAELAMKGKEVFMFDHTVSGPPSHHSNFRFAKKGVAAANSDNLPLYTIEHHIESLGHANRDDLLMKIDVEGDEFAVFSAVSRNTLRQFRQVVMEIHWLNCLANPDYLARFVEAFTNINNVFTLFHVHANNSRPICVVEGYAVADVLELSYVRSDLVGRANSRTVYPTSFDFPNLPVRPDHLLWFYPFLPLPESLPTDHDLLSSLRIANRVIGDEVSIQCSSLKSSS